QTGGTSTLIDNRGVAILPAFEVKNQSQLRLPTVIDQSNTDVELGKPVLTSGSVKFITEASKQFETQNLRIQSLTLPSTNPNQLNVKLTDKNFYIKMDTTGDSREQVGAYLAATKKIKSLPDTVSQYIDVRVPGRVFYK